MEKAREFDNILDECLDRVMKGQDIETILALYPEHAAELEPLLKTALDTRNAAAIKPRPEFRQRAGYEFQAAIREMPAHKARNPFRWQLSWMAPVAIVIVLLLAGGGTVVAANSSLPDSPLYRVKLATEAVQLAFASSDMAKAELYARFADERVQEIVKMADKGNTQQVEKVTERMNNQLIAMANLTAAGGKSVATANYNKLQAPAVNPAPAMNATLPPETTETSAGQSSEVQTTQAATDNTPPVIVTQSPETNTLRSPTQKDGAGHENGYNNKNTNQKNDRHGKLKNNLVKKTEENLKALQDRLEKAPEALKPAIQRAIDILLNGYEANISNLDR